MFIRIVSESNFVRRSLPTPETFVFKAIILNCKIIFFADMIFFWSSWELSCLNRGLWQWGDLEVGRGGVLDTLRMPLTGLCDALPVRRNK